MEVARAVVVSGVRAIVFARPWRTWTSDAVVYVVLPMVNDPFGKCFCKDFRSDRCVFCGELGPRWAAPSTGARMRAMEPWKVPSHLRGTVTRITPCGQDPNGQPQHVLEIRRQDGHEVRVEVPVTMRIGVNDDVDLTEELAGRLAIPRWWRQGDPPRPRFAQPPLRG